MDTETLHVRQLASFHDTNELYLNLTEALATRGVRQTVVSPRGFNKSQSDHPLISYYGKNVWRILDKVWFSRKTNRYNQVLANNDTAAPVHLNHAHSLYSDGVSAYNLWKQHGTPYVITIRNTDPFIYARYYLHLRKLARQVLANASHVIFANHHYGELLAKYLNISFEPANVSVIPNGIDAFWLKDQSASSDDASESFDSGPLKILSVGHVIPLKNHETLITGVNQHNEQRSADQPALQLTIVGRCNKGYGKRIQRKYESDAIRFVGALPFNQIAEEIGHADCFALISKPENFGIAYAEAVSQGLAVIYSEKQGFDGWVDEGVWGYSCPIHQPDAFVDRVLRIGKNHRLDTSAVELARTRFDWNVIAEDVHTVYKNALR